MTATTDHPRHKAASMFTREGEYWTIRFTGQVCRLKDSKGLRYLAVLLARPGVRIPADHLVTAGAARARATSTTHPSTSSGQAHIERARTSATRVIKAAIQKIAMHHPALGAHLQTTVRTGKLCCYLPDARVPIEWRVV